MIVIVFLDLHRFDLFQQTIREIALLFHGFQELRTCQLIPRRCHDRRLTVLFPDESHRGVQFFGFHFLRAAQDDRLSALDLIVVELAEVFHVHFALGDIGDCRIAGKFNIFVRCHVQDRFDDVGKFADAGRLDDDPVRSKLRKHFLQCLSEISDQRTADASGVHLTDIDPGIFQKSAVNADLTEFIFNKNNLLSFQGVVKKLLDQRRFPRSEESRYDINLSHCVSFILILQLLQPMQFICKSPYSAISYHRISFQETPLLWGAQLHFFKDVHLSSCSSTFS